MTRFFTCAVIVIGLGASATLAINPRTGKSDTNTEALFAADGAFRDGVYLGKLAAESGQQQHPAIGRWSTKQDRSRFAAGYRRGYGESLSGTVADVERSRSTE
jgi:hypothetical protein